MTYLHSSVLLCSTAGAIVYTAAAPLLNQARTAYLAGNASGATYWNSRASELLATFKRFGSTKDVARLSASAFWPGLDLGPPRIPLQGVARAQLPSLQAALKKEGFLP